MTKSSFSCLLLLLFFCSACSDDMNHSGQQSKNMYPDQKSEHFKQFAEQCSRCHRPPIPNIHTPQLWLSTVNRMQRHREQRGLAKMTALQKEHVLAYLQSHARQDVQP